MFYESCMTCIFSRSHYEKLSNDRNTIMKCSITSQSLLSTDAKFKTDRCDALFERPSCADLGSKIVVTDPRAIEICISRLRSRRRYTCAGDLYTSARRCTSTRKTGKVSTEWNVPAAASQVWTFAVSHARGPRIARKIARFTHVAICNFLVILLRRKEVMPWEMTMEGRVGRRRSMRSTE